MGAELPARTAMVNQMRQLASADPEFRGELAHALIGLAGDLQGVGRTRNALACIREAKQIYADRIRSGHSEQVMLGLCLNHEANWLEASNNTLADRIFAEEAAFYMSLVEITPDDRLGALVEPLQGMVDTNLNARRFRSAESAARACQELAKRASAKDLEAESYLASTYTSLGYSLMGQGKYRDALVEASRSSEIARRVRLRYLREETSRVLAIALWLEAILARECGQEDQVSAAIAEIRSSGLEPYLPS